MGTINERMGTVEDVQTLSDAGLSVSSPKKGKVLQFPKPAIEVSPSQVVELAAKPFDIHEAIKFILSPLPDYIKDGR